MFNKPSMTKALILSMAVGIMCFYMPIVAYKVLKELPTDWANDFKKQRLKFYK